MGTRHSHHHHAPPPGEVLKAKRENLEKKISMEKQLHDDFKQDISRNAKDLEDQYNKTLQMEGNLFGEMQQLQQEQSVAVVEQRKMLLDRLDRQDHTLQDQMGHLRSRIQAAEASFAEQGLLVKQMRGMADVKKKGLEDNKALKMKELDVFQKQFDSEYASVSDMLRTGLGMEGITDAAREAMCNLQYQIYRMPKGKQSLSAKVNAVMSHFRALLGGELGSALKSIKDTLTEDNFPLHLGKFSPEAVEDHFGGCSEEFTSEVKKRKWPLKRVAVIMADEKKREMLNLDTFDTMDIEDTLRNLDDLAAGHLSEMKRSAELCHQCLSIFTFWRTQASKLRDNLMLEQSLK